MERRFQVFVSSTFLDLQEERAAVVSALLEMQAIPAGMELFPAADDDAWTLIERVIDESDYYLLVIGGRYGAVDPASSLSFTEKEFDFAVQRKKPVMAFLHGKPQEIPVGKSETESQTREKLTAFRAKVEARKHVKYWTNPDDLAGKVARTFAQFQQMYPATGWIRGDAETSTEALAELNDLRKKLDTAQERLATLRTGPPPGTEQLAQGGDYLEFDALVNVDAQTAGEWRRTKRFMLAVSLSWDDIYDTVGPKLLDEATQTSIRQAINGLLRQRYVERVIEDARSAFRDEGDPVETIRSVEVTITDDDFGTVLVQLRALGLITRSERKRSVRDKGTYWTVTPFGDEYLTGLRAIRKGATVTSR